MAPYSTAPRSHACIDTGGSVAPFVSQFEKGCFTSWLIKTYNFYANADVDTDVDADVDGDAHIVHHDRDAEGPERKWW